MIRRALKKLVRGVAALFLLALTPAVAAGLVLGTLVFAPLPATIPEPKPGLESRITHVYDAAGNEIAIFREFETAFPVPREDIPQVLIDAVIASEDRSFYEHGGVDLRGTMRALWADVQRGGVAQGGSTITQQYVRQAFEEVGTERTLSRKVREAILAAQVDRQFSKDEILYRYLSTIYFGEGAYGVGAAAQTYFRKNPRDLTLGEAALLAGVIPAPSRYSPRDAPLLAENKRRIVLDNMLTTGAITQAEHDAAFAETLWLAAAGPPTGPATVVYPPVEQQSVHPWFTDYLRQWLETHLPGCSPGQCELLYRGGLRVETTLDPRAQLFAQDSVNRLLAGTPDTLESAIVAIEPPTGFVRALVGGRDFALSQVNTALTRRQPGSTFKTVVLAEALEQGIQPTDTFSGATYTKGDYTCRSNSGTLTLRAATTNSVNGVFCRLIERVTVAQTWEMATRLGITMPAVQPVGPDPNVLVDATDPRITYGIPTALGAVEVSPLDMASAYGVFANHGRRAEPTPVLRVLDAAGNPIIDNTNAAVAAAQVIPPEVADNVTDVLRGVLTDGTAEGRALDDRPAAGKTGTSQDNANAWFVGYTPTLSTAVWIGDRVCGASSDARDCSLRIGGQLVRGGSFPARTWQSFMNEALDGVAVTEFTEPAPIVDPVEEVLREEREGFAPGRRRRPASGPADVGWVPASEEPSDPTPTTSPSVPGTTTPTTQPPSTTTTSPPTPSTLDTG